MKNVLLTVALLLVVIATHAQFIIARSPEPARKMKLIVTASAPPVRTLRAAVAAPPIPALPPLPAGTELEYVDEDAVDYLVRVRELPPGAAPATAAAFMGSGGASDVYSFNKASAQKVFNPASKFSMTGGVATFPFKYRPKNGDKSATFEPSFSLSLVAGPSMKFAGTKDSYLKLLFGLGTSSITLTSKNTDPMANISEEVTRPAATFSGTLIFETGKVQFAVSLGTDLNFDNSDDRWIYQGNPWLSAGIGFDIFADSGN